MRTSAPRPSSPAPCRPSRIATPSCGLTPPRSPSAISESRILRKEIEGLETENASYQEQVLRAYQKIKTDEAMVARAKKAMAIALTVLDDQGQPKES